MQPTVLCLLLASAALAQTPAARREAAARRHLESISAVVKGRCVDGDSGKPIARSTDAARVAGRALPQFG